MKFTVYASKVEEVKTRLEKLAKKASKYGVPFGYTVSEEHPQVIRIRAIGPDCRTAEVVSEYTVAAVDFEIDCENLIRANGWKVLAKIEHGDEGNIVTGFGAEIRNEWYTVESRCDHCNSKRFRSVTFIVEKDGELKQVGSTCLKDYTGINPATAALWAAVEDILEEEGCRDESEEWLRSNSRLRVYPVEHVLAIAVDMVSMYGYRKSDDRDSTKDMVLNSLNSYEPTAEAKAKAEIIRDWLIERGDKALADDVKDKEMQDLAFEYDSERRETVVKDEEAREKYLEYRREYVWSWDKVSDIERNCAAIAKGGYAKESHVGRLAYIPVAYDKYMERKAKEEAKAANKLAEAEASDYVGTLGERISFEAATAKLLTSWETMYGLTFLYKFTDGNGNVFVWKASRSIELNDGMKLVGTVKDHSEYNGVKQTTLTRCKVA